MAKVVVTDFLSEPLDIERRVLGEGIRLEALNAIHESDLEGRIESAEAVIVYHSIALGRGTIERLEHCRVIVRPGVGYDNIDTEAAREKGIPVCNVPDYGTEEVADSTLAMVLSLMRGTHRLNHRLQRLDEPWNGDVVKPVRRLRQQVFGIVGCGRIGAATARRAQAFGFEVVIFDPDLVRGMEKALGVRRVDRLEDLLSEARVLSLHCPLLPATRHLIGRQEIDRLPQGGILVNTSRGGVVDAEAVVEALASGHLAGAGLDVLETEPPSADAPVIRAWRDPDHPAHERLILNPHAAFYCEEGEEEFRTKGALEVQRALQDQPLQNVVNGVPTGR